MFPVYAGIFNIDLTVNYILLLGEAQLMKTPQAPNKATDTYYDYRTNDAVCNIYETHYSYFHIIDNLVSGKKNKHFKLTYKKKVER